MLRHILTGSIATHPQFFDPPTGANDGSGGNVQQQQQQQVPVDPFNGIDMDLQPEHVRTAIEKSRTELQRLQTEAQQGAQATQSVQQLQTELQRLQSEAQGRQQQQPNQQQTPPTMDAQLEQYYVSQGLPADQAKKVAAMNKGAFDIFGAHIQQQIGAHMAPIAGRVVADGANDAFSSAVQNDRVGWSQIPEVQQALWDRTQAMAQQGQLVNPAVVENLAKILWFDHVQANGGTPPPNVVPMAPNFNNTPHSIPMQGFQQPNNQQSRFSFPGAGNFNTPRNNGGNQQQSMLDPETQAAINATTANWASPLREALRTKNGGR